MKTMTKRLLGTSFIFLVLAVLSLTLILFNENRNKTAILASKLEAYCDILAESEDPSEAVKLLPEELGVSVISPDGTVTFDTRTDAHGLENHLKRPEIEACVKNGRGEAIRRSATSNRKYFSFAKAYDGLIIRCAQPFEVELEKFFRLDWMLIISLLLMTTLALVAVIALTSNYARRDREASEGEKRRLKHEMTANISHELKTPVSSIQGYLEAIVNHPDMDPAKKGLFIERSYLQALRLSDMIRDISLITKLEEAPEQFRISAVNLKVLFSEVCEELSDTLLSKEMEVENGLPPICIRGSYNLIYSIFRNLVENSAKYAGKGCKAIISYSRDSDGTHLFDYRDNGHGVDEAMLDRIFERFFRLDADRSKFSEGSGLGLSIIRNAVIFHKGEITAYNVPGGGLGFRFSMKDLTC